MSLDPSIGEHIPAELIAMYTAAEVELLQAMVQAVIAGIDTPEWSASQPAAMLRFRQQAEAIAARLQAAMPTMLAEAVDAAAAAGLDAADTDLADVPNALPAPKRPSHSSTVAKREGWAVLAQMTQRLPGAAGELYGQVTSSIEVRHTPTASGTRLDAAQQALDILTKRGITGFKDARGRNWSLTSYVEMKSRTIVNQELIDSHTDRMLERGQTLIVVSSHRNPSPQCQPYEGQILSLDGSSGTVIRPSAVSDRAVKVRVKATLQEARSKGFQHPNAVLGDQSASVLGEIENAARSWYVGPSVNLTTARGNRLSVSPNHPVLTSRGWLPADAIRKGDQVFSRGDVERVQAAAGSVEHLDNMPSTFQQVFDSLLATGYSASVTPAADDFHGDGRHYKGEVHVVWAKGALLDVVESDFAHHGSEFVLMGSGVQEHLLPSAGALLADVNGVGGPVGRSLADVDVAFSEASEKRRVADAVDTGEVLAGLACGVSADEVVDVELGTYEGHCFDLQTSSGAYLTENIVVHNCRHAVSAYIPGASRTFTTRPQDAGYQATQDQRRMERRIRELKRQAAVAVTSQAKRETTSRLRAQQAALKTHIAEWDLKRRPNREKATGAR